MLTEQDVQRYLETDEKFLAGFSSRKVGYFYVPNEDPLKEKEGILILTSHRVLIVQKHEKEHSLIFGDVPVSEEVYSLPISNVNAVIMKVFPEHHSAFLTLVLTAGRCCRLSLRGSDVDAAQHIIARAMMMSEKTRQVDDDGAMTAIWFHEEQKRQQAIGEEEKKPKK